MAGFPPPSVPSDYSMTPKSLISLVGRGRLELPTNGLKARCGAHCKRESAHEKSRQIRTICPVRVKIPRTFAIRGFDSLQPPSMGRDLGYGFTDFQHIFWRAV